MTIRVTFINVQIIKAVTVTNVEEFVNYFRLYNGKAAENELKQTSSEQHTFGQDLVKHNLVVFRNGEGALKVRRSYI